MRSPLNYSGGKSRLASKIVEILPLDHTCYVEPFCGAAWVFFTKDKSPVEVLNDRDGELVCFWRVIQHHLPVFLDCYQRAIVSRKMFEWEAMKRPETLTDIQRAVRYYYLQRLSFGGKAAGRVFGTGATRPSNLNITDLEERLVEVHWRFERVTVECLDACDCIRLYDRPETVFYCDPPYWGTSQAYAHKYRPEDYRRLSDTLDAIKGRFVLSLNDCASVRELFKKHRIRTVKLKYSQGNSRQVSDTRSKERSEVIITNF